MCYGNPVREFLPPSYSDFFSDYYVYGATFQPLAATTNNQRQQFTVDADSDFLCTDVSVVQTDTAQTAEQTFIPALLNIQDSGSGQNWFDQQQHIMNFFQRMGVNGFGPFKLPHPRFVRGSGTVTILVDNLDSNARVLRLSFHGIRIYRYLWHERTGNGSTGMAAGSGYPGMGGC